jgi:signal transduction histidine kinase
MIDDSEREVWARTLHDETLQGLAAIRISIDMVLRTDAGEEIRPQLEAAAEQVSREIERVRELIERISPGSDSG